MAAGQHGMATYYGIIYAEQNTMAVWQHHSMTESQYIILSIKVKIIQWKDIPRTDPPKKKMQLVQFIKNHHHHNPCTGLLFLNAPPLNFPPSFDH